MPEVIVTKSDYHYGELKSAVFALMESLAGNSIQKNARVVIKPNLLAPAPPEKAVTTHPLIVRAAAEYVLEKGAKARVSDSPATGSFHRIIRECGLKDALAGLPVELSEFKGSVTVDVGSPFKKIEISADSLDADILINLPKLKTHSQMLLTLGVKNLFGCIIGMKKPEWHMRAGVDRDMFAALLVRVCETLRPAVTILDGILAMEGQGPGRGGTPRRVGVLAGSTDAFSLDRAVCLMLGMKPDELLTNRIAKTLGLVSDEPEITGGYPVIEAFRFPDVVPVLFGPGRFHGFIRRHLVQRPVCSDEACRLCGDCWKYCPAGAIGHDKTRLRFDYDSCIRCYCCIEVCPHGALGTHETATGKIARRLLKI